MDKEEINKWLKMGPDGAQFVERNPRSSNTLVFCKGNLKCLVNVETGKSTGWRLCESVDYLGYNHWRLNLTDGDKQIFNLETGEGSNIYQTDENIGHDCLLLSYWIGSTEGWLIYNLKTGRYAKWLSKDKNVRYLGHSCWQITVEAGQHRIENLKTGKYTKRFAEAKIVSPNCVLLTLKDSKSKQIYSLETSKSTGWMLFENYAYDDKRGIIKISSTYDTMAEFDLSTGEMTKFKVI